MGEFVSVVEKPSTRPGIIRYELNRSLSGMGHERFPSSESVFGDSASAHVARQLFATGQVAQVHIYANIVTVELERGFDSSGLADVVGEMYRYWKPGVTPPTFDDPEPAEKAEESSGDDSGGSDGDAAAAKAAELVPAHLLDRSRAAREKWNAKSG